MSFKPILTIFAMVVFLSASALNALAQGTTSRVTGTVTDSTGAAVVGATVTLTNEATATSLTTETSDDGIYTFDLIQIGEYTVTVEKSGFKKFVSTKNTVNINQPATVNVALETGGLTETVTVESAVEEVQTSTSGNIGSTIEQRTLESLPIVGARGRNPLDLLNFQPGVVVGANTGGGVHVNGSRDRSFNFTLDGIDINESTAGGSNFTPLRTNPDSIQEFQIVTGNFTAELGRSSGAQVTLITRAGTNRFSGNLFEYYQTPDFHANEYENNINRIPRRQFVQHIFGGSLGGPLFNPGFGEGTPMFDLLRDRAFFFVNLQFLRASETRLAQRTVYTQAARNGSFRYVVGGRNTPAGSGGASVDGSGNATLPVCAGTPPTNQPCIATYNIAANPSGTGIDPRLSANINSMPLPNDFTRGDGLNTAGFNFVAPQMEKQYDFVTRVDFKVNDNNQIYVRYAQGEQNTFGDIGNGGLAPFPGLPNLVNTFRQPKNLAINLRSSPSARFTNEFIFGYSTFGFSFNTEEPDPNVPYVFNLITDSATNFTYNARSARTIQLVDNVTFDLSPHLVKMGVNFRFGKQFDDRSNVAGSAIEPIINFSRLINSDFTAFNLPATGINSNDGNTLRSQINDFLGRVGRYDQAFVTLPDGSAFAPAGTRWNFTAFYPEYDFYVQDTWKFRPNLTFDLGLRYELKLAPSSENLSILRPNQPIGLAAPPSNTLRWEEGKLFDNDLNNFSPSIGVAWDPFKSGKTSVRANYRLAYDRFATFLFASSIFQSAPGNNTLVSRPGGLLRDIQPLVPSNTPNVLRQPVAFSATAATTVIDPDLVFPEIHQFFAGVQREIGFNSVLEVNYIGRRGTHLLGGYDANQVNIFATDPRCGGQTFLQAFVQAQANADPNCLATLLSGTNGAGGSPAAFRTQFSTQLATNQNAVATAAQILSQRSGTTALTANGFSPFLFQKYPQFSGALNVLDSSDVSRYNGLEIILKRRITGGVGFQVGYTYSMSKDTRSFDPVFTTVARGTAQSSSSTPFDNRDRRFNYAWSDFDRRHVVQATYVAELPFGRGKRFGSDIPKVVDFFLGGWQLAGNFLLGSGRSFTVYSGFNTLSNSVSSLANCNGCTRDMGRIIQEGTPNATNFFFSRAQRDMFLTPVAAGEVGNTGRNFFIGPKQFQTDASLTKKFKFTETMSFDLRVDARNLTNTHDFFDFSKNTACSNGAVATNPSFGRLADCVSSNTSRKIQFSGKFNF